MFRLKWNNDTIFCTKGRHYSREFPVKYIPRNISKNLENEAAPLRTRYLEKRHNSPESLLGANSKNHDAFVTPEVEEERDFMAETDNPVEMPQGIQSGRCQQDVEKSAIELLAARAFTAMELKKKLQGKKYPVEAVDAVIADFQSRGLINDVLYAEAYSRSRWSSSSWGPRRIRQALFKKGISSEDAEKAITQVFKNDEDGEDQDSGFAMSKLSMDQLCVQASKQWQRSHSASHEIRKMRMVRWLQYRGFNWSVIKHILNKLESGT
ncbi:hypothetical protein ACS0TY_033278 [Phlomoides rotata]